MRTTGDGYIASYDNDDDDYNCFVRSFQGTGITNDDDDDKLFLSATYQNEAAWVSRDRSGYVDAHGYDFMSPRLGKLCLSVIIPMWLSYKAYL